MIKKLKEHLASRKIAKLLNQGFDTLPKELKDIVTEILRYKPKFAEKQFQLGLKDKLLLKHRQLYPKTEPQVKEKNKLNWLNFNLKRFAVSFGVLLIVVLLSGVIAYPLIPPPKVLGAEKTEGIVEISTNAPFKIIFSQPMDRPSVEAAFRISPKIEGKFEWDRNVLMFIPEETLPLNTIFKVTITEKAQSLFQKNLEKSYIENFKVVTPPKVVLFTPVNGSIVESDTRITVMFDRPMKSLTTIEADQEKELKFFIEPKVEGSIKWLGTRSFQFIPEKLILATHYKVTIEKGLTSGEGGKLEESYISEFDTTHLEVTNLEPRHNTQKSGPTTIPQITFNLETNLDFAREKIKLYKYIGKNDQKAQDFFYKLKPTAFGTEYEKYYDARYTREIVNYTPSKDPKEQITENSNAVSSWIKDQNEWQEVDSSIEYLVEKQLIDEKKQKYKEIIHKNILNLTPKKELAFQSKYLIAIEKDIKAIEGQIGTENSFYNLFNTVGLPTITSYYPGDYYRDFREYSIRVNFSNPMDLESIRNHIIVSPEIKDRKNLNIYLTGADQDELIFYFDHQPSTEYRITLPTSIKDIYAQNLSKEAIVSFKTRRLNADFDVLSRGTINVLNANKPPLFYLKTTNLSQVNLKFKKLDPLELEYLYSNGYIDWNEKPNEPFITWEKPIQSKENKTIITKIDFNQELKQVLEPGYYYFEVFSDETENYSAQRDPRTNRHYFVLTNTALTFKHSKSNLLVWATDFKTGQPVSNIDLFIKERDKIIAQGRPSIEGIFEAKFKERTEDYPPSYYIIGKRDGGDFTFVESSWNDGIDTWQFNLPFNYQPPKHFVYLYTDRPIYRPDQTVYFKGIARQNFEGLLRLPEAKEINLRINDSQYNEVFKQKLALGKNGTFSAEFKLSQSAALGDYSIEASFHTLPEGKGYSEQFYENFLVAEYRRPDFKIDLIPNKTNFINGEQAKIAIKGEYFFGAALQNAPISYAITSQDYYFDKYEKEYYSFSSGGEFCYFGCRGGSAFLMEGKTTLDSNGFGQIVVPLELEAKKLSQIYTVEVTATDINNQTVSNRLTFPVHKGEFYLGIRTDTYVAKNNEPFLIKVISLDHEGKEIGDKKLTLKIINRKWNTIKKENVDGSYYYENTYEDILIDKKAGVTNSEGKAQIEFTLKEGGDYMAIVESTDERGNLIEAATGIYISSYDYLHFGKENNDRIELVRDKPEYQIGETAKLLVKSPYQNVKALLTIERSKILERKIIDIKSNSEIIEVPIKEEYLPNVYVSLVLVKGSGENIEFAKEKLITSIKNSESQINQKQNRVTELEKQIQQNFYQIENEVEREQADAPLKAEINTLKKEIEELNQKKVLIEIELKSLAENKTANAKEEDALLAAFKVGYTTLLVNTEKKRLNIELSTHKEKYLPGEEVTLKVKTLDINKNPQKAEISLSVVDASVLSLTDKTVKDLIKTFFAQHPLGITTAQTLVASLERINVEAAQGEKGGGGGIGIRKRGNFKDSAYWNAIIETNEQGEAIAKFTLPDNLTTWQILAIGATNETLVGSQITTFKVAQDIMIRPIMPRFLIIGDKITFGATVHNQTKDPLSSQIFLDVKGIKLVENQRQQLKIESEKQQKVIWHGIVEPTETAKLKFLVETGNQGDEVEISVPVYPYSIPEVVATSGLIQEGKGVIEEVKLPSSIDPSLGELKVTTSPTLAASISKGIEFLVAFPYGCAEQTASSLLPNLIVKQILNLPAFNNKFINLLELEKNVLAGLQSLYQYQQGNGGWGLWENSQDNPYVSAYVLYTLYHAKKAGYTLDQGIYDRGINYLKDHLRTHPIYKNNSYAGNSRAFILFILSEIDIPDLGLANNLYDFKDQLSLMGKAYLVMSYDNSIKKQNIEGATKTNLFARMNALTTDILNQQQATPRGVQFEEKKLDYFIFDSNLRTTAVILQMLNRVDRKNPVLEKILRHLLLERKNGSWASTQETSHSLLALIEFLRESKETDPNFWGAVEVNGKRKTDTYFSKDTLADKGEIEMAIKELLLDNQTNQVKIIHGEGQGNLYYDMNLRYFLPTEIIQPLDQGIQVIAEYYSLFDEKELNPLPSLKVGENYKGKITLIVPESRHYVVVEDKIPAGTEGIDFRLKTSSLTLQTKSEEQKRKRIRNQEEAINEDYYYRDYYYSEYIFNHTEVRDDRILFFADYLPKGVYELEYFVRATSAGKYHDKPATASEMYFPEVFGRSEGKVLEITE